MAKPELAFAAFPKISRLSREIVITEKIDGTNAGIYIPETGDMVFAASRTRWITPQEDNAGFARWAEANSQELLKLGPGMHFGEWWGKGIQRGYGLSEKRFSLFNVGIWGDPSTRPACCQVVPVLYRGPFTTSAVETVLASLAESGSVAAPGFIAPEGVVVFHTASGHLYKKTIIGDESPKGLA